MDWTINFSGEGRQSWSIAIGNGWTAVVLSTDVPGAYFYSVSTTCDHCTTRETSVYSHLSDAKSAALGLALSQTVCEGMGGECAAAQAMIEAQRAA